MCVDSGGPVCAWVGPDALGNGCPGGDWAEVSVIGTVHGDVVISFIVLLKVERDGDGVCLGEVGVIVVKLLVAFEEANIV